MADRYRRDHDYRNYGYDEGYGSIEQREDLGESPLRRRRPDEDRFEGQARSGPERGYEPRRASEERLGSEDRDPRWGRAGQRSFVEGRNEPRYGDERPRREDHGWQGEREASWPRRGDEWGQSNRTRWQGSGQEMGGSRDPWGGSGSEWSRSRPGYGQESSHGQGSTGDPRGSGMSGMSSWGREGGSRMGGWSSDSTAGTRGGFAGRGPKGYTRSDERIREDVCDRLSDDDDIDASEISVTVLNAEVTLEGNVSDRRSKHRAEDIADSVSGVRDVHNRLRAKKSFFQEMGDRLTGRDEAEQHGHHGSGTRNAPMTSGATGSGTAVKNGVNEPNRSM